MSGICVSVGPSTESARLFPRYDRESDILEVTSGVPRDWAFGVDIDGNIVFDVDSSRVLSNFDLLIPERLWERGLRQLWPERGRMGSLVFAPETLSDMLRPGGEVFRDTVIDLKEAARKVRIFVKYELVKVTPGVSCEKASLYHGEAEADISVKGAPDEGRS